jgi:hypothetical protein
MHVPGWKNRKKLIHRISAGPSFATIPKAYGFVAATHCVAGVSPARHAGILPAVGGSLIPIVVTGMGMALPL